jgi:hypothetical protein
MFQNLCNLTHQIIVNTQHDKETRQASKTLAFISTVMQLINQKVLLHLSTMNASALIPF